MARKVAESHSVAYFDSRVDEPGFYLLEGNSETTKVDIQDGVEFVVADRDDDENPILESDNRGRPMFVGTPEIIDTVSVKHETKMEPGHRVFPSPDGDGFVYGDEDEGGEN